jgi:hypothetical protein
VLPLVRLLAALPSLQCLVLFLSPEAGAAGIIYETAATKAVDAIAVATSWGASSGIGCKGNMIDESLDEGTMLTLSLGGTSVRTESSRHINPAVIKVEGSKPLYYHALQRECMQCA